ncbi:MAG: hypothetical protein R3C49_13720 [Planctomycetaceae bacterium]
MRAADYNVLSPLLELGITKAQVRQLAEFWNLSVADKPASPCLSSRIAYGVEVTPERVAMIEQAEAFLKERFKLRVLRVRLEAANVARIEVPVDDLSLLTEPSASRTVTTELLRLGFHRVTLDLSGFRSGSLNDSLPLVHLQTATP